MEENKIGRNLENENQVEENGILENGRIWNWKEPA